MNDLSLEQKFNSADEYKKFVEHAVFLVDGELKKLEILKENNDHHAIALALAKNVSAVNFIGYLRGQDNMFVESRLHVDFQKDLYKMEDELEKRLWVLIDYVKTSESKDLAEWQLNEYYLKHRGFNFDKKESDEEFNQIKIMRQMAPILFLKYPLLKDIKQLLSIKMIGKVRWPVVKDEIPFEKKLETAMNDQLHMIFSKDYHIPIAVPHKEPVAGEIEYIIFEIPK